MTRAKALGIDAFALNIGVDPYTDTQLGLAYASAARNDMKVFLSFDFNWYHAHDAARVGAMLAKYGRLPAQLVVDGKVFASSFGGDFPGDKVSVPDIRAAAAGVDVFFAPNFSPALTPDHSHIDAALNWMAWPNNGRNKAPDGQANFTVQQGDEAYRKWLGSKPYIAPVSAWFSTHFGPEVPYSKNWVFPSDRLWFDRWTHVLQAKPQYLEILTWNDYGESHYVGPLSSPHDDDGNSKWVNDMPHDGWLDMAKPFMAAFKAGHDKVDSHIDADQIVYWFRPTRRELNCDATDTTVGVDVAAVNNASGNFFEGRPNGWHTMQDSVFVVTLLTAPANVTVSSGTCTTTFSAPAGAFAAEVPMATGRQSFSLSRDGRQVHDETSLMDVADKCRCGIYNFNAYVGTVPSKPWNGLRAKALAKLTDGIKVADCKPINSILFNGTGTPVSSSPDSPATPVPPQSPAPADGTPAPAAPPASPPSVPSPPSQPSPPTPPTPPSVPSPSSTTSPSCNAGTASQEAGPNFLGLCAFSCARGYCPPGVCVCTAQGTPQDPDANRNDGMVGCPKPGLGEGYRGLCRFSCARQYCPPGACTMAC